MTDTPLYTPHPRPLALIFNDLESYARGQRQVIVGTPGSVIERENSKGFRAYVHQNYDGDGKRREKYLAGPVGGAESDRVAAAIRNQILELKELVPSLRLLGREGYNIADAKTYATLAALFNAEVFKAGATLIGSHAFGVLLNQLGVRAKAYLTEDIDIARREALAFEVMPDKSFLEILQESGIEFVEVPQLDAGVPATSFKQRGKSRFRVDLLVPSPNKQFPIVPVPELKAYATGLPYLGYLLGESQMSLLIAREGCCLVRVPSPQRFAIHKLLVAQLRGQLGAKVEKDIWQAAVLLAVLAEIYPGAIEEAIAAVPKSAKRYLVRSASAVIQLLLSHPRAVEEFNAGIEN